MCLQRELKEVKSHLNQSIDPKTVKLAVGTAGQAHKCGIGISDVKKHLLDEELPLDRTSCSLAPRGAPSAKQRLQATSCSACSASGSSQIGSISCAQKRRVRLAAQSAILRRAMRTLSVPPLSACFKDRISWLGAVAARPLTTFDCAHYNLP